MYSLSQVIAVAVVAALAGLVAGVYTAFRTEHVDTTRPWDEQAFRRVQRSLDSRRGAIRTGTDAAGPIDVAADDRRMLIAHLRNQTWAEIAGGECAMEQGRQVQ